MSKSKRKPQYWNCPMCLRKIRINQTIIPKHEDFKTGTLCVNSGKYFPQFTGINEQLNNLKMG